MRTTTYQGSGMTITEDFSEWLEGYKKEVSGKLPDVVAKNALAIQAESAKNAPVDTGNLKNSLNAQEQTPLKWTISDETEYGVFQELGTSRGVTAKHFLGGAAEKQANKFFDDVLRELKA